MMLWIAFTVAIVLMVILLCLVGYILCFIFSAAVAGIKSHRGYKEYPPCETPLGLARYDHPRWSIDADFGDGRLHILLDDVDGAPNPNVLQYTIDHWDELSQIADVARRTVPCITGKHVFGLLTDTDKAEICLGFSWEEEYWGETVFVDMSGMEVVTWTIVD